jgi:hypothetical protein
LTKIPNVETYNIDVNIDYPDNTVPATKEEKELLLKDLCARLPYGVKVAIEISKGKYTKVYDLREIDNDSTAELRQQVTIWNYGFYSSVISYPLIDCRPYLRPMSSMTEEEKSQYNFYLTRIEYAYDASLLIDWCNKNHFDYRGLIPEGLAIEVNESNNPYK